MDSAIKNILFIGSILLAVGLIVLDDSPTASPQASADADISVATTHANIKKRPYSKLNVDTAGLSPVASSSRR